MGKIILIPKIKLVPKPKKEIKTQVNVTVEHGTFIIEL